MDIEYRTMDKENVRFSDLEVGAVFTLYFDEDINEPFVFMKTNEIVEDESIFNTVDVSKGSIKITADTLIVYPLKAKLVVEL